ncbi:hypothetical protein LOC71_05350 [Rhodopirellula sp. JC740]|uniref:Uncharacterized protein n=1 Tax=Rhodopirellula halodulae TaxID=2894198 RepID=A0ABS8NFI6_9BACT|nr:hypothetical protein [Rhodopirellula sp. JC740]MCC9641692.1 hypothetical protein [Rhodopirellula sp. JC740]
MFYVLLFGLVAIVAIITVSIELSDRQKQHYEQQIREIKQQINIAVVRTPNCLCGTPATHQFELEDKTYFACNKCLPNQLENV